MSTSAIVVTGEANTRAVSTLAQRGALNLECLGLTRHGRSVYSIVKQQYGFKGNKVRVLKQLEDHIEKYIMQLEKRYTPR